MNYNIKYVYEWPRPAQIIILIGVFGLVFYLGYFLTINSLKTKIKLAQQQVEDSKTQLQLLYKNYADVKEDLMVHSTIANELTNWKRQLVLPAELPELLNNILKIGAQNGLVFNTFSPDKEVDAGPYIKVAVRTTIEGTYDQIGQFISQIANMEKVIVIENFSLSKSDQDTAKAPNEPVGIRKISAEMLLEIYEVKPK